MLRILFFLECAWLIVDSISGFFQNQGIYLYQEISISAAYKFVVFLFTSIVIIIYGERSQKILFSFCLSASLLLAMIHAFRGALFGDNLLFAELQMYMKVLLPLSFFCLINIQLERDKLIKKRLDIIIIFNSFILLFNYYLGFFNVGFSAYEISDGENFAGSKGFFFAGNEVAAAFISLFALVLYTCKDLIRKNIFWVFFICGLFFIGAILSATKTTIVGFLFVFILYVIKFTSASRSAFLLIFGPFMIFALSPIWYSFFEASLQRWEFFWHKRDFGDFITSGRSGRLDNYKAWLFDDNNTFELFIGSGSRVIEKFGSFENDILDISIRMGLFSIVVFGIWLYWAWLGYKDSNRDHRGTYGYSFYLFLLLIALSVFAGHVMYSATVAPFVAILAIIATERFRAAANLGALQNQELK